MRRAALGAVVVAMSVAGCGRVLVADGDGGPPLDAPAGMPTVLGTLPEGPANDNLPLVRVNAMRDAVVTLHRTEGCTDDPIGTGTATGDELRIAVGVPDDSSTTFWARASSPGGMASPCSLTFATYVEDSTAPDPPRLTGTEPPSPSDVLRPDVLGLTEAGATLTMYLGEDCAERLTEGVAEADGTFRIPVEVAPDTTTVLSATATDAAGNVSACSEPLAYRDRADVSLTIAFPPASSQTDQASITVRGSTVGAEDVTVVRVAGVEATTEDGFATWSALVELGPDGETSRLEAVAETVDGALVEGPAVEVRRSTVPNLNASDMVVDPAGGVAYVVDISEGRVQAIELDTGRVTALPSGGGPRLIEPFALDWDTTEDALLVGSIRGEQLLRIDPDTGLREEVSGPVRGSGPRISGVLRIAFDGVRTAYLASTEGFSTIVLAVDTITGDRRIVPELAGIGRFAWDPNAERLVYFDVATVSLLSFDPDSGGVATLSGPSDGAGPALGFPFDFAVDARGNELIVAAAGAAGALLVDLTTGDRRLLPFGSSPGFVRVVAYDAVGEEVVFVGNTTEAIWRLPRSGGDAASVFLAGFGAGPTLEQPTALALGGGRLFVADDALDAVFEVDLGGGDRREISRADELGDPVGLAYDALGGGLYVRDLGGQVAVVEPDLPGAPIRSIGIPPPVVTAFTHVGIDVDPDGRRLFIANRPAYVQVWDLEASRLEDVSTVSRGEGPLPFGFLPGGLAWTGSEVVVGDSQSALTVAPEDGDREDVSDGGGPSLGSFLGLDADDTEIWLAANRGVVAVDRETRRRRVVASETNGRGPAATAPFDVALLPGGEVALVVTRQPTGIVAIDRVTLERVLISR